MGGQYWVAMWGLSAGGRTQHQRASEGLAAHPEARAAQRERLGLETSYRGEGP